MRENQDIINYILYTPGGSAGEEPLQARFSHQLKRLMDWMPGGFFIYRSDGEEELLYANEAVLRLFQCGTMEELRELTGNSFRGIVHPEDLEEVEESIRAQIADSQYDLDYVEYRIVRKDGQVRWVDDYGHFIHSEAGDVFCVFISDTTEKRLTQLQRERNLQSRIEAYHQELEGMSEEYLRRLEVIEGLSLDYESIFYIDLDTDTIQTYQISERMEEQIDRHGRIQPFPGFADEYLRVWVHPEDRERLARILTAEGIREKLKGKRMFDETYRILKNGETEYLQLHGVNTEEEKLSKVILGAKSVDEVIRSGMKRREVLESALQQATSAMVAKNAFLTNMSHDMRTPMNAILGFTALARRNLSETGRAQSYLDMIEEAGNQLLKLVNDVLEIARMEAGKVQLSESAGDLEEIVRQVAGSFGAQAAEKALDLSVELALEHPNVFIDREKVEEILGLFLDNAVKYTPPGGQVSLQVRELDSANRGYGRYCFSVTDNGPGMEQEFLERIFAPFERENNTTVSGIPGTGLGLSIARSLAAMMGGAVEVESALGQGSRFSVTFTLRLTETREASCGEKAAHRPGRRRDWGKVLVVEDNELNMELAKELLEAEDFQVDVAWNGEEAVERVKAAAPGEYAIIIMDIQMPVMDGYEATRAIRALEDPRRANIPIVALSANAYEEDRRRSSESGMNAHVSKPMNIPELLGVIGELLFGER